MFWDFLYQLTARDGSLPQLIYKYARATDSGTKTPCTAVFFDVPPDQIFIPTHWAATATPAAATNLERIDIFGLDPTANFSIGIDFRDYLTPGPLVPSGLVASREFLFIPGGWSVRCNAAFSATTGNNQLSATIGGFFAPKGNLLSLV
jgi:hypothetical protein